VELIDIIEDRRELMKRGEPLVFMSVCREDESAGQSGSRMYVLCKVKYHKRVGHGQLSK